MESLCNSLQQNAESAKSEIFLRCSLLSIWRACWALRLSYVFTFSSSSIFLSFQVSSLPPCLFMVSGVCLNCDVLLGRVSKSFSLLLSLLDSKKQNCPGKSSTLLLSVLSPTHPSQLNTIPDSISRGISRNSWSFSLLDWFRQAYGFSPDWAVYPYLPFLQPFSVQMLVLPFENFTMPRSVHLIDVWLAFCSLDHYMAALFLGPLSFFLLLISIDLTGLSISCHF